MTLIQRKTEGEEVADGVFRTSDGVVNWYLVRDGDRLAAVDAGFPSAWQALDRVARRLGRRREDVEHVVLTHGHIDHIGFAERLRSQAGAKVHVHPDDAEILRNPFKIAKSERSPLRYAYRPHTLAVAATGMATGAPRAKAVREWQPMADGDVLEDVPGRPRVIHTPGHTFGHCVLFLEDRGVLFTGDALVTRDPYTGRTGPRLVARAATADLERALASLDRIATVEARTLLSGHGEPWNGSPRRAAADARAAGSA